MFAKLHPPGGLYRYRDLSPPILGSLAKSHRRKVGRPRAFQKSLLNAFFLVDGKERCVDISFFRYLEQV